jgi:hypothetical protein
MNFALEEVSTDFNSTHNYHNLQNDRLLIGFSQ